MPLNAVHEREDVSMAEWLGQEWVTELDLERSRTCHDLNGLRRATTTLAGNLINRLVDIGCGYGGLAMTIGSYLAANEIHGVDVDERVVAEAERKGVQVTLHDAGRSPMPYP